MTFGHVVAILRARWLSILMVVAAGVGLAIAASNLMKKQYTSSATVLIDVKSPDPINGLLMQGMMTPSYMNTQVDLIMSEPVARRAVRELGLLGSSKVIDEWRAETGGEGEIEAWAAKQLSKNLKIAPAKDSNLVEVAYTSRDPSFAALAANAYVKAFTDTTLLLRQEPAKRHKEFFDQNAKQLRADLEAAQARLSAFEHANGLLGDDKKVDVETNRLMELSAQYVQLQAEESKTRNRRAQANGKADLLPEALESGLVATLRAELQRTRARLGEIQTSRGPRHPEVLELTQATQELQARINEETGRISSGLALADRVNRQGVADLRAALDAQREKVGRLKVLRDDSLALRRDVENAQRSYDAVLSRANQMGLESQVALTNVSVVGLASVSTEPSSPKLGRNLIVGLLLGLVGGVALAFMREFNDQRIRLESELPALLQQPMIVALPRFGSRRAAPELSSPGRLRAKRLTAS